MKKLLSTLVILAMFVAPAFAQNARDLRAEQRPGKALGHAGWSFKTHDLDGALEVVTKQGGVVLSAPLVTDDPIHGKARLASAETPEGAFIELWEAI